MIAILIPAYEPGPALLETVLQIKKLREKEDFLIVIVNDGSQHFPPEFRESFKKLNIVLLEHEINQGKGAALKTGISHIQKNYSQVQIIITVDADGQHLPEDVLRLAQQAEKYPNELILGVRSFTESEEKRIPLRSRFGNILTRKVFKLLTRKDLVDTQTGLRAIPASLFNLACQIDANRYDYELEFLLAAAEQGYELKQLPIQTVYLNHNDSSHFRPLVDSLRIYFIFLRFIAASLISAIVDFGVFFIGYHLTGSVFYSFLIGRIISATGNYFLNKFFAFHSARPMHQTLWRYCLLALIIYFGVYGSIVFFQRAGVNIYLAKILSESLWFILSFAVQRFWLFRH